MHVDRRAAIGVALLVASARAAADEKEFTLALTPAASMIRSDGSTSWGGGGGLDVTYGVTDALSLRATGAMTAQYAGATADRPSGALLAYHAGIGLSYAIDIVRVVPSLDFSIGLLGTRTPASDGARWSNDFGVELGLAIDYLLNRRVSVGAVARWHGSLTSITQIPAYLYVGPRLSVHFGG